MFTIKQKTFKNKNYLKLKPKVVETYGDIKD